MHPKTREKLILTAVGWLAAGLMFFPIFWMVLTSFKTELGAFSMPPALFFEPTLENYEEILERTNYLHYAWNSIVISGGATLLGMLLAVPAAYAFAFHPDKRTHGILMWMLSTKMLPSVGVLVPIYLLSRDLGLLDSRVLLVVVFALVNLPIMVWMDYTYFRDIPRDILEAARMDGASSWQIFRYITFPHLRRYLELGALLGSIYVVQNFDHVFTLTAGALGTANLPYTIYQTFFTARDYGLASAIGVVAVIGTIIIATFALRVVSSLFEEEQR